MFETGMSALVLKICSEYAKSLGLNFPPCTQQEINAICQWVDKHTVKDLTMEQNGDNITFKFVTENDTIKEFTFSIPEQKVDIDTLERLLIGSETVTVERAENNSALRVRLSSLVTTQIKGKLDKPTTPSVRSAVVIEIDGKTSTKPLSEIGGGKLYLHHVQISIPKIISIATATIYINIYSNNNTKYTKNTIPKSAYSATILSANGNGTIYLGLSSTDAYATGVICKTDGSVVAFNSNNTSDSTWDVVDDIPTQL